MQWISQVALHVRCDPFFIILPALPSIDPAGAMVLLKPEFAVDLTLPPDYDVVKTSRMNLSGSVTVLTSHHDYLSKHVTC